MAIKEDAEDEAAAAAKKKRGGKAAEAFGCPDDFSQRQASWIAGPQKQQSWRPVKLHRLGAKHWLMCLDNQIRVSTVFGGLSYFIKDTWTDKCPFDWPGLQLSIDLGSDGVSAWHALLYHWNIIAWLVPDESHSIKNYLLEVLKAIGLYDLWLLLLISFNLEHGPRNEEQSDMTCGAACRVSTLVAHRATHPCFSRW